jgi:uncharacterized protein DUF6600
METVMTTNRPLFRVFLSRLLPLLLLLVFSGTGAMAQTDPPTRVASLSHMEGSVVLAPDGDTEWTDAVLNRPITRGDRLWADRGSRAEVHLGSAVLHVDGETFLDLTAVDDQVFQASLKEGTVNARIRELAAGENFEVDTPHLAFRASQPGAYRIDVDPARGATRVTVRSGMASVFGASGEAQQLQAGQQIAFTGRNLERVAVQASPVEDGFDRWAADRNRMEDQSIAAHYVPREVVGYQQLDAHGSWAQDPSYGPVWYPRVTVADWAPYRYGHWQWIAPWGWTWIDDAPWGFAPFHYGRWAVVGSRWCWVPGRIGPRPIYSPALVAFVGGGGGGGRSDWNLSIGSGRGIAWYPLAPGEAWRPTYRTSPVYVRNVNRNVAVNNNAFDTAHVHRGRREALTAVRVEDFSRGRPVHNHWTRVNPADVARAPLAAPPAMPEPRRNAGPRAHTQPPAQVPGVVVGQPRPPAQSPPPAMVGRPQPQLAAPGVDRREPTDRGRAGARQAERPPQVRQEEPRARGEQRRQPSQQLQLQQQERARRDQQAQQERVQREQQPQRQLDDQRRAQQGPPQREQAVRQQQATQERLQHQQELQRQHAAQQQQQQQAIQQQRAVQQQQQQAIQQQQRAVQQQQRAVRQQEQTAAPAPVQAAPPQRGEVRERGRQESREERRSERDEEGRGRGRGYGRGG